MKTYTIDTYNFDELSKEAKEKAIENQREKYYKFNDFSYWAIDDCYLLEPKDNELDELFGKDRPEIIIKNNRKIYFSLDRNRYINIKDAMEITSDYHFLKWLGLTDSLIDSTFYTITEDSIIFEDITYHEELTEEEDNILRNAIDKFEEHCQDMLNKIEADIEYRFSDEAIKEDIISNEIEFTEDGEIY